jgi:hypothetical protein
MLPRAHAEAGACPPAWLSVDHGSADSDTPPEHSQRVLAALAGPKRLILVSGARHNESLRGEVWTEVERWIDQTVQK